MSNTVVYGKAAPIQVAGAQSRGYFFQNLGTSPVYLGYDTSVNSGHFDGLIQPGGTYTSGVGRAVYLYADSDTPVVYNDDSGANANAGTNVTASIPGTLDVNVGNAVTVEGNVGIVGNVGVAGNVNVQGSVNAFGQQTQTVLSNFNFGAVGSFVGPTVLGVTNVTAQQSIGLYVYGDGATGTPELGLVVFHWTDLNGNKLYDETFDYWISGNCYIITPVKGANVQIQIYNIGNVPHNITGYVFESSILLPELYTQGVPNGPAGYYVTPGGTGSVTAGNFDPGYGVGFLRGTINANGTLRVNLSSMARQASYYCNTGANANITVYAGMNGGYVTLYQLSSSQQFTGVITFPKAPIWIQVGAGNTTGNWELGLSYERY